MAPQDEEIKVRFRPSSYSLSLSQRNSRDLAKEDARKAVHAAINNAYKTALENDPSGSAMEDDSSSFFNKEDSTLHSHEQAMDRGAKRGSIETNESERFRFQSSRRQLFLEDVENTPDRTRTTVLSGSTKGSLKFLRRNKKVKEEAKQPEEAWMCGVCSKTFTSYEAAAKHEDYHIKEVLTDLGWTGDEHSVLPNFFGSTGMSSLNEINNPERSKPPPKDDAKKTHRQQNGPDVLRVSTPLRSFKRASVQPFTPALQRKTVAVRRESADSFFSPDDEGSHGEDYNLATGVGVPRIMTPIHEIKETEDHPFLTDIGGDDMVPLLLADEALVDVCRKAESLGLLTSAEQDAEFEIECLAKDKAYYDLLFERQAQRKRDGTYRFRREGTSAISVVQNKFVDAYQLMKEGKTKSGSATLDYYTRKLKGNAPEELVIDHSRNTVYVNVMVKESIKVVRHELERLAKKRWEDSQRTGGDVTDIQRERFQKFRAAAQGNLVKLAQYALTSDFTPRRIAVQLSNDLYRLLTPRLKRRGVVIETEIEYRVGPYFVLAVNILNVHWRRLVRVAYRDVTERRAKWKKEQESEDQDENKKTRTAGMIETLVGLTRLTRIEVLAQVLAWMYYVHWTIFTPICFILYQLFPKTFRTYFLSSVADEIFYYVEQKGMQMDIGIRGASTQAAFMLSALREIRADGREQKKKKQQEGESSGGMIIGPLLGPAVKSDNGAAPPKPAGFEIPTNLGFVGLELDVPVGFKRLRWAILSSSSTFMEQAVFQTEAKYENITFGTWSKHDEAIGNPTPPNGVSEDDFVGAEKEFSYLMPKSAFVKANMCYETAYVEAYNDYCFCMKKKALTPEVPYGSSFIAWTKFVVINNGNGSSKLICSVEPEFPNGPPLVARQIQNGMKAGVGELFVKIGETITKYADQFP